MLPYLGEGMEYKVCSKCKAEKPLSEFHKRITKTGKNIGQPMCKACKKMLSKERYEHNTEKVKQINKKWREAHPEAMDRARKNWIKKSYKYCPSFYRACGRCKRAGVFIAKSFEELNEIREFYKNCPDDMTVDHIVPISRGGTHTIDNLQYLSFRDNCRKSNKIL